MEHVSDTVKQISCDGDTLKEQAGGEEDIHNPQDDFPVINVLP